MPYSRRLSLIGRRQEFGIAGGYPYLSAFSTSNQTAEGRMYNDYYGLVPRAQNRARSRFISKLRQDQSASIGACLGEWKQSFSMIGDRLKQLYTAYKAVRSGDIYRASRALSAPPPPNWRKDIKKPANLWLEWHFGWSPMLGDIFGATQVLSSELPQLQRVTASASAKYHQGNLKTYSNDEWDFIQISGDFKAACRLGGFARLVNRSLGLADQLGLVNPVTVAWELVPWSFLVDHVIKIGSFIDSFTDTLPWEFSGIWQANYRSLWGGTHLIQQWYTDIHGQRSLYGADHTEICCFQMNRSLGGGLPPWCLYLEVPFRDMSVARAATYCSLLLQQMSDYRKV